MPDLRTEITEIVTGLGTLGLPSIDDALEARPREMIHVEGCHWDRLTQARQQGKCPAEFEGAWLNGQTFLHAREGLRNRTSFRVEWKGAHRPPGYDLIPADLRIDHVYLVSCKYLSKILFNASPSHLFDRCLQVRRGAGTLDWYAEVALNSYQSLYAAARKALSLDTLLPEDVRRLTTDGRVLLKELLQSGWPVSLIEPYADLCRDVAESSAERWNANMPSLQDREEMLWRLLRLAGAPYFVLGASGDKWLRLRIETPWDWRQRHELRSFDVWGDRGAGQPLVRWRALVRGTANRSEHAVDGHVEVRWSHGRFRGHPEAKVYLDTPHERVPGYNPLA